MAAKRFPKTGEEALTAMLLNRYTFQSIADNLKKHANVSYARSTINLVANGNRAMVADLSDALVKTAKALEVKVPA